MGGFYMEYLMSLCQRRAWDHPAYDVFSNANGYTCSVLVNGREYQTDSVYASDTLAKENAAMRAFMVCRNFSVNNGMLARNGIVQGMPMNEATRKQRKGSRSSYKQPSPPTHAGHAYSYSGNHSSSSSTASLE